MYTVQVSSGKTHLDLIISSAYDRLCRRAVYQHDKCWNLRNVRGTIWKHDRIQWTSDRHLLDVIFTLILILKWYHL